MSTEVTTTRQVTMQGIAQKSWDFDADDPAVPGETLPVESVTFGFSWRIGAWALDSIVVRCYKGKGIDREIISYRVETMTAPMPMWLARIAVLAAQVSH